MASYIAPASLKSSISNINLFNNNYSKENFENVPDGHLTSHPWSPSSFRPRVSSKFLECQTHKASGHDNIPTRLLITVAEEIAQMLTTIFQTSLDTATVTSDWREALITPLYKKYLKPGKGQVEVILLDFAKAFDKGHFHRLLLKLNFYGIRVNTLQWISSFLHKNTTGPC